MNEYQVSDYKIFDQGISSTKSYLEKLDSVESAINESKTTISDESVFMGPIQESCINEFTTLNTDYQGIKDNMNTLATFLQTTCDAYKSGDASAADKVLSATDTTTTTGLTGTLAEKKQQFLGSVDDPNNYDALNPNFRSMRKSMTLFDNTTGEILQDGSTIHLKPGETRVITVKLPTDTGMIQEIHRTTADGNNAYRSGSIVTAKSDIDPDPNKIDYVNYKSWSQHYPSNRSLLHNNSYDWVITGQADGSVQASQTCEYTTDASGGSNLKAMIQLSVVVDGSKATS